MSTKPRTSVTSPAQPTIKSTLKLWLHANGLQKNGAWLYQPFTKLFTTNIRDSVLDHISCFARCTSYPPFALGKISYVYFKDPSQRRDGYYSVSLSLINRILIPDGFSFEGLDVHLHSRYSDTINGGPSILMQFSEPQGHMLSYRGDEGVPQLGFPELDYSTNNLRFNFNSFSVIPYI